LHHNHAAGCLCLFSFSSFSNSSLIRRNLVCKDVSWLEFSLFNNWGFTLGFFVGGLLLKLVAECHLLLEVVELRLRSRQELDRV